METKNDCRYGTLILMPGALISPDYSPFKSFFMGGFECATHRTREGKQIDVIATTKHDHFALHDYALLAEAGVQTVRDGLRWHLIESAPGVYDWSSFLPMLQAATDSGTQVIWDLCHWGVPAEIDVLSPEFPLRFAAFARATATVVQEHNTRMGIDSPPFYCAINEISFWSWIGGDRGVFDPYLSDRGPEMKRQLVRASIAAIRAIRIVDPSARFVQPEPLIHISPAEDDASARAAEYTESQFEAWDMLAGLRDPDLGGGPDTLDYVGVNYYWNNQWIDEGATTPPGHLLHRPLHQMLYELWKRYDRPVLITETGTESGSDLGWVGYVTAEVRHAQRMGVPFLGICLYPVMDYCGWDDERHCKCGLIEVSTDWMERGLRKDLQQEIEIQARLLHG